MNHTHTTETAARQQRSANLYQATEDSLTKKQDAFDIKLFNYVLPVPANSPKPFIIQKLPSALL